MKNSFFIICIFFIGKLLFLSSCGQSYFFDEKKEIQNSNWTYQDTLDFTVDVTDTLSIYNMYLDINHSTEYSFQNIYIRIHTKYPNGQRVTQQVPIDMMRKVGIWYGDCNSEVCDLRVTLLEDSFFNALGKHTLTIEQFMRKDPLEGINSMALRIEDTGQKR